MLIIKTLQDQKFELVVFPQIMVLSLKQKIMDVLKVDVEHQRLLFSGKVLQDDATLEDYGLVNGNAVHLCTKIIFSQVIPTLVTCDICSYPTQRSYFSAKSKPQETS